MNSKLVGVALALSMVHGLRADVVGYWKLDDYDVGTVLKEGTVFKNSVNPGAFDAVLKAVDADEKDESLLPMVVDGFTGRDMLLPTQTGWFPDQSKLEKPKSALRFQGGGKKGWYLEVADPSGALKTSSWTLEVVCRRDSQKEFSGTPWSMPATTDGTMDGMHVFACTTPLGDSVGIYKLKGDSSSGYEMLKYPYWGDKSGKNDDNWYHLAAVCNGGCVNYLRFNETGRIWVPDATGSAKFTGYPDMSSPLIIGGDVFGGMMLKGDIVAVRLSNTANNDVSKMMFPYPCDLKDGETIFHATFDNSLDSVVNADCVGAGNAAKFSTYADGKIPELRDDIPGAYVTERSSSLKLIHENEKAINVCTGYVSWANAKLMRYQTSFTLEFFFKDIKPVQYSRLAHFEKSWLNGGYKNPWGFSFNTHWQFGIYTTKNQSLQIMAFPTAKGDDGAWHHCAITIDYNPATDSSTLTSYLDGAQCVTASGSGALACASSKLSMYLGHSDESSRPLADTMFDEFRITKGVLPPEKFLKARKSIGLILFLK